MPSVTYIGTETFEDQHLPRPIKNEWGMDVLTRTMKGSANAFLAFYNALVQGQTYFDGARTWYLQTFDHDSNAIFPTVTLTYKGLVAGIPAVTVTGETVVQTGTLSCSSPEQASRTFAYYSRQSVTRYITTSRPSDPTHTSPDVNVVPFIYKSEIRTGDGTIYLGNAPAGLVTALTPVGTTNITTMTCSPVIGSPWFECSDTCSVLLPGS